jgi:hypothetical protein
MGTGATCLAALAGTTGGYSPSVPTIAGPCFVTDPQNITVDVAGVLIPFQQARIAGTYSAGSPPGALGPGMIRGFLTVADAMTIVFPDGAPSVVAGDTLYEHLAAGRAMGSSCSSRDDRDPHPVTMAPNAGFWFYLQFAAIQADWVGP